MNDRLLDSHSRRPQGRDPGPAATATVAGGARVRPWEGSSLRLRGWRWGLTLAAVFVLALAWRLSYLWRLGHTPLAGSLIADARTYWDWAGFLLAHGPLGKNPFFMGPLYPYVLAPLRLICGNSIPAVLAVQCAWGAAAAVLLADAARRLTRPAVGLAVGLLVGGYEMAVFFDGLLLMESLLFFLESLLLWMVVRQDWDRPRARTLLGIGLLVGLLAQGRASSAVLLVPLALLLRRESAGWRDAGARLVPVLAAFVAVSAPAALRNYAVSREWIPFTYNLGLNLYVGNNPAANGSYADPTLGSYAPWEFHAGAAEDGGGDGDGRAHLEEVEGLRLGPSESAKVWTDRALAFLRENPGEGARLAVRKLGMLWNRREYPQIESAAEFRAVAGPLGVPGAGGFAFLGALALAGIPFAWRAGGAGRFVVGYAAAMTLAMLPFFVTDRYRHHLVPAAALLAGCTMAEAPRLLRTRERGSALRLAAGLAAGAAVVSLPLPGLDATRVAWDTACDLGDRWLNRGRPDQALPRYHEAISIERSGRLLGSETPSGRMARAELYANCGTTLLLLGRDDEAASSYRQALRLAPGAQQIAVAMLELEDAAGRHDEARAGCERLGLPAREVALDLERKASVAAGIGEWEVAERLLLAAIALDSTQASARRALVRLHARTEGAGPAVDTATPRF